MKTKTKRRAKGTGTIFKSGCHFFWKKCINGKYQTSILQDADGNPVTTRKDAELAAARDQPILRATQQEEIAFYVAEAKGLKKKRSLPIERIWETYLAQYQRPDSSESTLRNYQQFLQQFQKWLRKKHPEVLLAGDITTDIAGEFFNYIWNQKKITGNTSNHYRQALKLIFKHIQEVAGLDENPFRFINRKPVKIESRKAFTEDQVRAIFSGFDTGFYYTTTVGRLGPGRKHVMVEKNWNSNR